MQLSISIKKSIFVLNLNLKSQNQAISDKKRLLNPLETCNCCDNANLVTCSLASLTIAHDDKYSMNEKNIE